MLCCCVIRNSFRSNNSSAQYGWMAPERLYYCAPWCHFLLISHTVIANTDSGCQEEWAICYRVPPVWKILSWHCPSQVGIVASEWATVKQINSIRSIQIEQLGCQGKATTSDKFFKFKEPENLSLATHSIFSSDAELTIAKKLLTGARCGRETTPPSACMGKNSKLSLPMSNPSALFHRDKPPLQQFSSLKTQHDQWKSQHDQQGAEAEQRIQNYVRVQQRSVHTKHRIPEVIRLPGQMMLCKKAERFLIGRSDTDL